MSDPHDLDGEDIDRVARDLHDALHHDPPLAVSADPGLVEQLRRRSAARRRAKVAAVALVAAGAVVASAVALTAGGGHDGATHLAAGGSDTTSTLPVVTTTSVGDDDVPLTSEATTSTGPAGPTSSSSTSPSSMVAIPTTTIPSGSSTTPYLTTSTSVGGDCGSWSPVGWPTTFVFSPDAAQCLLDAFATGTRATFHLVVPDVDYPTHQITEDFLVVGVRLVQVRVDRTDARDDPKTVVTERCRQLTFQLGAGEVYAVGNCTVTG